MMEISSSSRRLGSSSDAARGGACQTLDGRYERKSANGIERFFFARHFVVHRAAAARVDFKTAEFFLGNFFADAALHHRRSGDEELARSAHHQRKVRRDHAHRAEPGHRTQARADHRHFAEHRGDGVPGRIRRHVGASDLLDGLDAAAAAGAVHQPDHRDAQAARQLLAVPHFVADGARRPRRRAR